MLLPELSTVVGTVGPASPIDGDTAGVRVAPGVENDGRNSRRNFGFSSLGDDSREKKANSSWIVVIH